MPRVKDPPQGDRFFARVEAGRNECPRCGYLDQWYTPGPVRGTVGSPKRWMVKRQREQEKKVKGQGRRMLSGWNPLTSRWQCPSCRMTFTVGLVFWPVTKGGAPPGKGVTIPADQVLDYRQLGQLRAQAEGLWMREPIKGCRAEGSNITARCSCAEGTHGTAAGDPGCPFNVGEGEND